MATRAGTVPLEIEFDAPPEVREGLAAMGRTEDVRLAPGGRRLAIACFARELIAVADVEIDVSASGPEIAVTSFAELSSPAVRQPHGIDFVDDDTLVVADRSAGLSVFRLPPAGGEGEMAPVGAPRMLDTPGSVAVRSDGSGRHELLVCDNWANTITRHALDGGGLAGAGEVVLHKWLDLPDGVTISNDGRWLAVSNHNSHTVFVYASSALGEDADPVAVLRGAHYPHGLRFGAGGRHLVVADAGAPYVYVFAASSGTWRGASYPALSIRVMDDDTFARGRHNPLEGGPKGLDLDPRTNVLVVTAECLPLAFFDLGAALDGDELRSDEDALTRYELFVLEDRDRLQAAAAEAKALLRELQQTKAWRLAQPMQRAYGAVLRLRRRGRRA